MLSVLTTIASYNLISANLDRTLKVTANQPQVARDSEYYLANIEDVKSIDDFMGDDRLFNYAMKAWGLGEMSYAKAFMRKVLTEGIESNDSFANTLSDSRYREFAKAFNFQTFGSTTTVFDEVRQGAVDRYVRQQVEEDAGNQNEGVRLALYFERKASGITSSLSVLADKALLQVVETALGLPQTISLLDLDQQVKLIDDRLDVEDLQDPEKLSKFLTRFTALWEINNPTSSATSPALLIQPVQTGFSADLLSSLQNLRLGGL
jgi:Protein of unknown function (DUF1217)